MMSSTLRVRLSLWILGTLLLLPQGLRAQGEPRTTEGLATVASSYQSPPDTQLNTLNVGTVNTAPGFEASAALLFLQPSSGNMVYASTTNGYPLLTPRWTNRSIDPDFSPAFNVGLRYRFEDSLDVQLDWTHLNTQDKGKTISPLPLPSAAGIPPPNLPAAAQAIGPPFLIGPPLPYAVANGEARFDYEAINLTAGVSIGVGNHVQLRPFAGLQGAYIDHTLDSLFDSSDSAFRFRYLSKSTFTGVGPRVGMDMHYVTGRVDLVGGLAGLLLMGTRETHIDFLTSSPSVTAAGLGVNSQFLNSQDATQVIGAIDGKLGGSYSLPIGNVGILTFEAGYQGAVYFDAINQYSLTEVENSLRLTVNDEGTSATFLRTSTEQQTNFFVHGPYLKLSYRF